MGILLSILCAMAIFVSLPAVAAPPASRLAVKHNNAGVDLFSAGKYEQAIAEYSQAIKESPRYAEAYSNRGAAYDALNESVKAVEDYSRAIQLDPGFTAAYSNRAEALIELRRFAEALPDWQEVIKRNPRSSSAYLGRGICLRNSGELKAALDDFKMALKLDSRNSRARQELSDAEALLKTASKRLASTPNTPFKAQPSAAAPPYAVVAPTAVPPATDKPAPSAVPPAASTPADAVVPPAADTHGPVVAAPAAGTQISTLDRTGATPLATRRINRCEAASFAALCSDTMHQLLGGLCLLAGQYQLAADHYRQATVQNPADAFAHFRFANVCSLQGDERTALKEYEMAVECSPHFRQAYVRRERLKRTVVVPVSPDPSATEHAP